MQYLTERQIDLGVARKHCQEIYYKHNGKPYFALAFGNESGGYEIRNKYFKGCISPKDITVVNNNSPSCAILEGFMDYLSFLTLCAGKGVDTSKYDYLILNSVAKLSKATAMVSNYQTLHAYLDNDTAGRNATAELRKIFGSRLVDHAENYREYKDLNDYPCGKKLTIEKPKSLTISKPKPPKMKL